MTPPLFSLGSSHLKVVGTVYLKHFFREVKEIYMLAVDSRGEPIDVNIFLSNKDDGAFFSFLFPIPPKKKKKSVPANFTCEEPNEKRRGHPSLL